MRAKSKEVRIFVPMKQIGILLTTVFTALTLAACGRQDASRTVPDPAPSVYYWRTVLDADSAELAFVQEHGIRKVYLHYFDVGLREGRPVPLATLQFRRPLPDTLEIVPTVFLTEECLHADTTMLAERLVERVLKMTRTHHVRNARELQLDCDWAASSRQTYFDLLANVRERLRNAGWRLSVTIRLHQLSQPAPPADYGVLMLYNTGDFRKRTGRNPILDTRDVEPFLHALPRYPLPLCAAYPNYQWQLLYEGDNFRAILYDENLADSIVYAPIAGDSLYCVVSARTLHGALQSDYDVHLKPGQEVIVHRPKANDLLHLHRRLEAMRPGLHAQTVLYHLDKRFLNQYSQDEYATLFHP